MNILGIGTAVPAGKLRQADAAQLAEQVLVPNGASGETIYGLYRLSGVKERGSVLLEEAPGTRIEQFFPAPSAEKPLGPTTEERLRYYTGAALQLASRACRAALSDAGMKAKDITHLVTVSCTGFESPGVDIQLISELGLSDSVQRTHIGFMGCHGALNGLRVARALAADGGRVLLACVEICSLHMSYTPTPDNIVANSLFADGAGAFVIAKGAPGVASITATGSRLLSGSIDAMAWRITDHGFQMELSPLVPSIIERDLPAQLSRWLNDSNLTVDDIHGWAIHPGGPRVLDAVRRALGLSTEAIAPSRGILARHGNMSSPTVIFILEELRKMSTGRPWVMLAFGPGLTAEYALLT